MGTNKFTNETVLQRWKYAYKEGKKRNVHVLSFGGDGDSRVTKAMYTVTALKSSNLDLSFVSGLLKFEKIPSSWKAWFIINNPDIVHIAVKLKCRLLKPSVVLPMGNFVAGSYHIHMVKFTYGKDQHGLQERDVDCKDKQNYDAVLRIIRSSKLLANTPDTEAVMKPWTGPDRTGCGRGCAVRAVRWLNDRARPRESS